MESLGLLPSKLPRLPSPDLHTEEIPRIQPREGLSNAQIRRLREVALELNRRQMEALSLFDPLPKQLRFHKSLARTRMIRGSNRSGKSQCAGAEIAWALSGAHPYIAYPKEGGIAYCVGWDHRHVGQVLWKIVGRPGAFKIIRDEVTGRWRVARPWQEYDAAYREKWRDASPFLPDRLIKSISWESKKDEIPKMVKMINGWECNFASSKGAPQAGIKLDLGWIDEEIENHRWYSEMVSRVSDRITRFFWSATPLAATQQLYELHQKCHEPDNNGRLEEILLLIDENPYIPQNEKDEFKARLSPDELRVRYYGEFALAGFRRYAEYMHQEHCVTPFAIPPDWTHYMAVDPGTQVCAVLFAAVPPSASQGVPRDYELHIYDELYIKRCSAMKFGEAVSRKMGHLRDRFEAFIIDGQYGRQMESGIGKTVEEQYSEALREFGVKSSRTGHGFIRGGTNLEGREGSVRRLMQIRASTGSAALRIHIDHCSHLDWELKNQFYRRARDGTVTDKRKTGSDHCVDCLEYLASYDPQWRPPPPKRPSDSVWKYLRLKRMKQAKKVDAAISLGPMDA